eukprot:Lankesteria_metandrocarpae@DN140_c0_g1_i1.p1
MMYTFNSIIDISYLLTFLLWASFLYPSTVSITANGQPPDLVVDDGNQNHISVLEGGRVAEAHRLDFNRVATDSIVTNVGANQQQLEKIKNEIYNPPLHDNGMDAGTVDGMFRVHEDVRGGSVVNRDDDKRDSNFVYNVVQSVDGQQPVLSAQQQGQQPLGEYDVNAKMEIRVPARELPVQDTPVQNIPVQ